MKKAVEWSKDTAFDLSLDHREGWPARETKALFSSQKILNFGIIVFSFLFDKYYPIMD